MPTVKALAEIVLTAGEIALAVRRVTHILGNNYFHIVKYPRGMAWL
jgi:hypothetical protein